MIADVFIRRPVLSTVCSLLIILAGAVSIPTLPIARYPDLAPPSVTVSAFYTGANAQAVESAVTTPLEQAINGVEGMTYITSSSTNSGFATITVTFDVDRNQDLAAVDVQNRVNQALGRMPAEVRQNGISVVKVATGFIGGIGLFSRDNRYSSLFISNYIDLYIRDAIKRVPGVGDVIVFGERKFAMRLWLDPTKLAGRNITAGDVLSALREQNVQVAAGALGDAPAPEGQAYTISVRAMGRLSEAPEFNDVVVKAGKDGALVRVKDVGRVELGAETYSSNLRFLGLEAQGMGISLLPNANAIETFRGVVTTMDRLKESFPPGLEWQVAFDNVVIVRQSIVEVLWTLVEAIGLVILVMFLFLQNWRSTIIPAITIPVSLIGTFAFIKLFDFSINVLTLFGIVLATGIVVDDAIVVIENIERHMRESHKSARQAASEAMAEVFSAVVVIGIVLVAVFVPVAFFPGVTGRLYQQFSLTIAFAVVLSVFNAVTLAPALAAMLLDKESHTHGRFFTGFNRVVEKGTNAYVRLVRGALRLRYVMLLLFVGGLLATYTIFRMVPSSFVPQEDEGYLMCIVQAPAGASLEYTTEIAKKAEKIIYADQDVAAAFSILGFSFSGAAPNNGMIFIRLKDYEERQRKDQSLQAVLGRLSGPLFMIPGAIVAAFPPPSIQGLSRFGGFQFEVLDQTGSTDINTLAGATLGLMGAANQSGEVQGAFSSFRADDPQLIVDIDRDKARSLGLPLREVTDALQVFLGSQYVNDFDFNNRAYRVYVQADQRFRASPGDLRQLYARASNGDMVPLDSVVRLRETTAPQVISHFNLFRSAEITGNPAPGRSSGQTLDAMEQLARANLPAGYDFAWAGQSREERLAGGQSALIFGLSLLLVYLVLSAQYESFILPLIILLGVPLAVFGALSAQLLRGFNNDVFCQVGLVLLVGLAAKNSILIVEFAEQLRGRGLSIVDAAIESARIRLRPILMTSFAFILGVMPLALATGAGAASRNSVGTAVAGGMLASTFLSIVFIPVLYVVIRSLFPGRAHRDRSEAQGAQGAQGAPSARSAPGALGVTGVFLALALGLRGAGARPNAGRNRYIRRSDQSRARKESFGRDRGDKHPAFRGAAAAGPRADDAAGRRVGARTRRSTPGASSAARRCSRRTRPCSGSTRRCRSLPSQWALKAQALDQVEIARLSVTDTRRQIAVATASAYLAIIAQKRLVEVSLSAIETARSQLDYNTRRREGGVGSRLNELRSSQLVSSNEAGLEVLRFAVRRSQEALGVLLAANGPVDAGGEPAFEIPQETAEAEWLPNRPDIKVLIAERDANERIVNDSKKDWWPLAAVTFGPQLLTPAGLFQPSRTWALSMQLSQPLFEGGQRQAACAVSASRSSRRRSCRSSRCRSKRDPKCASRAPRSNHANARWPARGRRRRPRMKC